MRFSRYLRRMVTMAMLGASLVAAADDLRILVVKSRPAAEMIPLVQPMLSPGDYINASGYQLIVRTSPANFRQIEQLLAQIDRSPQMLTVTVRQVTLTESQTLRQSVSGSIGSNNARVTVPGRTPDAGGGVTVIGRDGQNRNVVRYEGQQDDVRSRGRHNQMVRVMDGQRAFIQMGQSVVLGIPGYGGSPGTFIERSFTNGFDVLPRTQGDAVMVEILPHLNTLRNPRTGEGDVREAGTTVRARRGEWIDIGEIREQSSTSNRALAAGGRRDSADSWRVMIKVD